MRNPAQCLRLSRSDRGFRLFRAFLACIISLALLLPFGVQVASAQTTASNENFYQNVESDVPKNFSTFSQAAFFGITTTAICYLTGIDITNPERGCLDFSSQTQKLGYAPKPDPEQPGGLLGASTVMIGMMYTQPVSSTQYVRHLASDFGLIKSAQAQPADPEPQNTRSGFDGLEPLLALFVKIRDITYLLLVIVFIVVGIGIMLRINIDPRTVMTIQNQIPKLIIGILLVTFSYSIAGLLFDATWVVTYFGINTITSTPACEGQGGQLREVATTNLLNFPFWYVSDVFSDAGCFGKWSGITGLALDVAESLGAVISQANLSRIGLGEDLPDDCGGAGIFSIFSDFRDCAAEGVYAVLKWTVASILFIVLAISIFIQLFKVWYMLLRAYISLLIAIILAPFWIIMGAIPGGGLGFGQWMRHMVAHLAIFPAAALMFTLASYIASSESFTTESTIVGSQIYTLPLLGNPRAINFGSIMALGFILLTPDLLNIIRDALKSPAGKYTGNIFKRGESGSPTKAMGPINAIGGIGYSMGGIGNLKRSRLGRAIPFFGGSTTQTE